MELLGVWFNTATLPEIIKVKKHAYHTPGGSIFTEGVSCVHSRDKQKQGSMSCLTSLWLGDSLDLFNVLLNPTFQATFPQLPVLMEPASTLVMDT